MKLSAFAFLPRCAFAAHTDFETVFLQAVNIVSRCVLNTLIGMMDNAGRNHTVRQGPIQRTQSQARLELSPSSHPMIRREKASSTTARKMNSSSKRMYVISATHT